ncbi:MAG: SIS domain-containing protein [Acidobacteria bacterium]|nr:SIS domain-containing protein [Acidobacteriota bacterium]
MLAEIEQQPEALERTLREVLPRAEALRRRLEGRRPAVIVLVARGTSDNAATFGRYLLEITTGLPVSLAAPSVTTLYGAAPRWQDALVVGVSQSGASTDVNVCLETARAQGAFTIGVTNESRSALAGLVDEVFPVLAGPELSVAATKTYTGQMLGFYLLAFALGAPLDTERLREIPETAEAFLSLRSEVEQLSERYRFMERAVVLARGLNYANALELSLKLMETCYVTAERFSTADFRHGPIALAERDFPVFLWAPPGPTAAGAAEIVEKLGELQAETVVMAPVDSPSLAKATRSIVLPSVPGERVARPADLYTPIPYIIPGQLLAAALAEQKGLDPDQPRALRKVTQTL